MTGLGLMATLEETTSSVNLNAFESLLPVPMKLPAQKLSAGNEPWTVDK